MGSQDVGLMETSEIIWDHPPPVGEDIDPEKVTNMFVAKTGLRLLELLITEWKWLLKLRLEG